MSADFDREIDRAVREMLDVEPPASIRARVLARIEAKPRSGEGGRHWEWIAAPVVAAALVVLALMLRPTPSIQSVPIAQVVTAPAIAESLSHSVRPEATEQTRSRDLPAEAGSSENVAWLAPSSARTIDIAPLAAPAPINVRPAQPRPLDEPGVAVDQLPAITPISIEPLPPGRH